MSNLSVKHCRSFSPAKSCYSSEIAHRIHPQLLSPLAKTILGPSLVEIAQQRNPSLNFAVAFPDKEEFRQAFRPGEKFDYILFSDIGDTVDALQAFRNLKPLGQPHSRVLITTYNHLWEPLVTFAEWTGIKVPRTEQNWLSTADIRNLLKLAGFEALETHRIVLLPKYLPVRSGFLNRLCPRQPFLGKLSKPHVSKPRAICCFG